MTESADRTQRPPPPQPPGWSPGFSGIVREELAKLRGKHLGACATCGKPVFLQQSFTRFRGRTVHVRCPINTAAGAPLPLSIDGVLARHLTSRDR